MEEMRIRHAVYEDLQAILDIYAHARKQMALCGNPRQWGTDKPSVETVREDIRKGQSYVIVKRGCICGVFAFMVGEEPTYRIIEDGAWLNREPYGTVHRVAGNGQSHGILAAALSFCEEKADNIRIDTHADNTIMQHLLDQYGYTKCGHIYVADKTQRIAYQKKVGRL